VGVVVFSLASWVSLGVGGGCGAMVKELTRNVAVTGWNHSPAIQGRRTVSPKPGHGTERSIEVVIACLE
jgi:hypothetical protein